MSVDAGGLEGGGWLGSCCQSLPDVAALPDPSERVPVGPLIQSPLGSNGVLPGSVSESTSTHQSPAQARRDLERSPRLPPPGSPPWYPPVPPPDFGGNGVSGSKVTRACQVPEAEAQRTSGAQRAAMLEQRRRRRGASWVPAAAPVGWGRGPSRAVEGLSARRQGRWAGRPAQPRPPPHPHPHPVPSDRTLGLHDPSGSPRRPEYLVASETPASTRGSGPRDADSYTEGSDLPPPGVRLEEASSVPHLSSTSLSAP